MAPMAGVTDAAFRQRLRRNGCRCLTTEMVSAAALARRNRRTLAYLQEPDRGEDLTVQLFGADPDELARGAELAQEAGFARVDFNMGCPVRKVVRSGAGAALLQDLARAERCLAALRRTVSGVLTVKIRAGWDGRSLNFLEAGRVAEGAGVDGVTLHARTRAQGYGGQANWGWVEDLVRAVAVPVVGNGDIATGEEAVSRLRRHGCAGVMVGRGALARPWLFRDAEARWAGGGQPPAPDPAEIGTDLLMQLADLVRWRGERGAVLEMRKFLAWGVRGLPGSTEFRRRVQAIPSRAEAEAAIRGFFGVTAAPGGGEEAGGVQGG